MNEEMDAPRRLSISEETLRLQLAELELRLRIFFSEQLAKKADALDCELNASRLDALERGDFTPAHRRALEGVVATEFLKGTTMTWTRRERVIAVISLLVAAVMLFSNVYVAITHNEPPAVTQSK